MADIARLAGVSASTVSRALSNSPLVNATVGGDNRLGGRLVTAHLLASGAQLANAFSTVWAGRVMVKGPAGESSCEAVVPMMLVPKRRSPGE